MTDRKIRFQLDLPGMESPALTVLDFEAREGLGDDSCIRVRALTRVVPATEDLLGGRASVTVAVGDEEVRHFHGVVRSAAFETPRFDAFVLRVEIGSRMGLLRLGRTSRLYTDKSVP